MKMRGIRKFLSRLFSRFKKKTKKAKTKKTFLPKFDERTEKHLKTLLPEIDQEMREFVALAKKVAARFGMTFKVISSYRSPEEQAALYAKGRTTAGSIVTKAKPYSSTHNYRLAIDGGLFKSSGAYLDGLDSRLSYKIYKAIADNAEDRGMNIEAGVNWKSFCDPPHFHYKTKYNMAQLKQRLLNDLPLV